MSSHLIKAASRLLCIQQHISGPAISGMIVHGVRSISGAAQEVLRTGTNIDVCDSHIHYVDTEVGDNAVIFLHGNPTSSFLWRNIIPHVKPIARCLAPDLIGMGKSGKEPNNSYTFADHYKYLSKWIESVNLPDKFSIVCHDWGSGLGLHWANQHRDRIEALIYMEAIVAPVKSWDFFPEIARNVFQGMRSSAGEEMVLKKNFFVERLLPGSIMRQLTDEEMDVYREPYMEEGESRRPTLTWPREIPVENDGPQYVVDYVKDYRKWLSTSESIPKLFVDANPGFFSSYIRRVTSTWPNQKTVTVDGLHFIQEDSPDQIGQAINGFLQDIYNKK